MPTLHIHISSAIADISVVIAYLLKSLWQNWTVHGLYWGSYKIHNPRVIEDSLKELLCWLARGSISVHISHSYRLSEVRNSLVTAVLVICVSLSHFSNSMYILRLDLFV